MLYLKLFPIFKKILGKIHVLLNFFVSIEFPVISLHTMSNDCCVIDTRGGSDLIASFDDDLFFFIQSSNGCIYI